MYSTIESLESRTLFSAASVLTDLKAEAKVMTADAVALKKGGSVNFKLINSDVKAAGELKSSKLLLKNLQVEGSAATSLITRDVSKTIGKISGDVNKLVAVARQLLKHHTNATFFAKVTADINTLQIDANNRLATITADITAQHDTDAANVEALIAANPTNTQLATDVDTVISENAGAARAALETAATTALTTGVSNVIAAAEVVT